MTTGWIVYDLGGRATAALGLEADDAPRWWRT